MRQSVAVAHDQSVYRNGPFFVLRDVVGIEMHFDPIGGNRVGSNDGSGQVIQLPGGAVWSGRANGHSPSDEACTVIYIWPDSDHANIRALEIFL